MTFEFSSEKELFFSPLQFQHAIFTSFLSFTTEPPFLPSASILWQNSLVATPIAGIVSDWICGILFKEKERSDAWVTVAGVYLPCGNLGMDVYQQQLEELERVVLESKVLGSVVVMGDFNAHLEMLAGVRGQGGPNMQGVLLEGVMRKCGLYAASQSEGTSGLNYTYWSGEVQSTVDYILMCIYKQASMQG